jgi:dynactin 1
MGPPPPISASARISRQSVSGPVGGPAKASGVTAPPNAGRGAGSRLSLKPAQSSAGKRLSLVGEGGQGGSRHSSPDGKKLIKPKSPPASSTPDPSVRKMISPALSRASAASGPMNPPASSSSRGRTSPTVTQRAGGTIASREVEDLKTKLRVMEKKRMEDRDKLKALERIQGERDKYEGIIQKLQMKYQPQQQEMADLRKQIKEADAKIEEFETQQAEHDMVVEMATLDREMAEENAEVLKTELEALKQKAEELELECEVLREENDELGQGMSPEEKTSQGWLQMERQNERLREALVRLRDMTQQQEGELKDHIKSLEEDLQELSEVKEQYEATKQKLAQSETNIEDLRQQLDTAESAEEMLEELTQRNLSMSEQIEELNATIEDLESLKELNDELEINHVETEKQMQEELDFKDLLIAEQARKASQLEETMEDYEYTIARFRGLVTTLQSDLEDMRASQQLTETEAEELASRSRAMMDLNMKLQLSASKTQVKTIDLELRRLEAQEAAEHLAIVQLFLPEAFYTERDSVLALLRFRRVGFKSNLLHGFVKERVNSPAPPGHEDDVLAACDVLDKLVWVTAMCDRFVNCISGCTVQQFAKFEGALYELEPVERALNGWIDGLRRDELKEKQCAAELQR